MDLSKLSIEARTRTAWEALDLGFVITRAWWKPLFLSWFIPAACVFIPLMLLFGDSAWIPGGIVWLLKPLWDRGPLFVASRRLFGEQVSSAQVIRALYSLYKKECLLWLTLRRFSFTRSFDMPLTVLENISGQQRSARQMLLHRSYSGAASWLTIVGVHVEFILASGVLVLVYLMIPEQVEIDYLGVLANDSSLVNYLNNLVAFVVMCMVGPFYSVSGFAMYISRRIDLEAWDIEIRFRHLVNRQEQHSLNISRLNSCLFVLLFCSAFFAFSLPQTVHADTNEQPAQTLEASLWQPPAVLDLEPKASQAEPAVAAKQRIITILQDEAFHQKKQVSGWRLKDFNVEQKQEDIPGWLLSLIEFFENNAGFFKALAEIVAFPFKYLEVLLWLLLVLVVVLILIKFRKPLVDIVSQVKTPQPEHQPPTVMFGLDVTRESLPDDVPQEVTQLWQAQEFRKAISLLYRALLSELIHRHGFAFADSDTEGECIAIVKQRGETPLSRYTALLTACWQNIAYGHIVPDTAQVELLCREWHGVIASD